MTEIDMPSKKKYTSAKSVIKNGAYKPRTGNSHPKPSTMKRVPKAFKT